MKYIQYKVPLMYFHSQELDCTSILQEKTINTNFYSNMFRP